jgi:hypothetical protein
MAEQPPMNDTAKVRGFLQLRAATLDSADARFEDAASQEPTGWCRLSYHHARVGARTIGARPCTKA